MPPDRSWVFGMVARAVMRVGHGSVAFMALQSALLVGAVALARRYFPRNAAGTTCFGLFAVLALLDPLTEAYVRFYMTDLVATLLLLGFVAASAIILDRGITPARTAVALACIAGAVFVRVAAAPAAVATLGIAGLALLPRWLARHGVRVGRHAGRLAALIALPFVAIGLLAGCNMVVFGDRYGHQPFVNRQSSLFLAGIFAPALGPQDFTAAGIPIEQDAFDRLRLGVYDIRVSQIWGAEDFYLHTYLRHRLDRPAAYDPAVETAAGRLVASAFDRDPFAFARILAFNVGLYFRPAAWAASIDSELGLNRPLPDSLVDLVNARSAVPIATDTSLHTSRVLGALSALAPVYPAQLAMGVLLAGRSLARPRAPVAEILFAAALLGMIAVAGLYSPYVIPRYVLLSVLVGYGLLARAIASFVARRDCPASTQAV